MVVDVVEIPVCKPCPACGIMPKLSREFNRMRDGKVRTIFCEERHYFLNANYGEGNSALINVWNSLVDLHGKHIMGVHDK